MTHEELIQRLAQQLGWSDVATTEALDAIISVLKAELTANNPVDLDDFGKFSTLKEPEYILTDRETNDRYLMPPVVEVLFESSVELYFTPEDSLNESVNGAFSFFEPTSLHEGVALPGVPEVIVGGDEDVGEEAEKTMEETTKAENEKDEAPNETEKVEKETEEAEKETEEVKNEMVEATSETVEVVKGETVVAGEIEEVTAEIEKATEKTAETEKNLAEVRKEKKKHKKTAPLWIPIAGGVAIALAALFFFMEWHPGKNESSVRLQQRSEAEALSVSQPDILRSEAAENRDASPDILPDTMETNTLHREVNTKSPLPEVKKIYLAGGKTLRLLAQDLFGNREFWVYIYLENKSKINNPNRVPAGTELIVPDRTKYDIDAADPGSVARAKNQGNKILSAPGN
ncbi:MAG: HU family DNA-binding protein [Porphyromonadaceae bacterium]|nr:HU family DNA-binding protein [Porphyromonadaceae bacterium]